VKPVLSEFGFQIPVSLALMPAYGGCPNQGAGLIAKPTPKAGGTSCSTAMQRRGTGVVVPNLAELIVNTNDEAIIALLSRLLGIPENRTDVPLEQSRDSYDATIQHTYYYLFQKQGLVTNKEQLFYRQTEQFQPQAIRDTLPILLGVSSHDRYELEDKLRTAQRDLKINAKFLERARDAINTSQQKAISLLSEAKAVGIIGNQATAPNEVLDAVRTALQWKPAAIPEDDGQRVSRLEEDLNQLRRDRRELQF
jgi:hypothetical protein